MPLYDITFSPRLICPADIEKFQVIEKARKTLTRPTFDKMVRTVDIAIDSINPSANNNLIWTKSGVLFGNKSSRPLESIQHLWTYAEKVFGDTKYTVMFVGSLLLWRISDKENLWLTVQRDTGKKDPDTDKEITERHYWIDNNFKLPQQPTVEDLMQKFNRRR